MGFIKDETGNKKKESFGPPPGARRNESILLVDDEITLLMVQKETLEFLGYRVTECTRAVEALEIFQAEPERFDLLITDQAMPEITGHELARQFMEVRPNIPVILCTGSISNMTWEKAKALGIRELLKKPYDIRDLAEAIRRVLG